MARSTKASNAVLRLKQRSGQATYSMVSTAQGLFYLTLGSDPDQQEVLCAPLEMDEFVAFVDKLHQAAPRKVRANDLAFESKLKLSKSKSS